MNLPNYFLADLPPEATLNRQMLWEACQTLKRNREQYLAGRSTRSLIKVLHDLGQNWLDGEYPFRKLALEKGPEWVAPVEYRKLNVARTVVNVVLSHR